MKLDVNIVKLSYPESKKLIIRNIRFSINSGEILCIGGNTGCGKTTLLKVIAGLIPNVRRVDFSGNVILNGNDINGEDYKRDVSFGFQEPEHQFLLNNVKREIFFHLNNKEVDNAKKLIKNFSFSGLLDKSLSDLSTGQRKVVSIITTLSKNSKIKILDEPSANIDEINLKRVIKAIKDIKKSSIIILSSHDEKVFEIGDKFLLFDENKDSWSFKNRFIADKAPEKLNIKIDKKIGENIIEINNLNYKHLDGTRSLNNFSLSLKEGEIVGLIGKNGCGKTTLANIIAGKLKVNNGEIKIKKDTRVAMIMQEPEKQLFFNTLKDEIAGFNDNNETENVLKKIRLFSKKEEHPYFLSRGEKQLLIISSVINSNPEILIIDEPFTGLDKKISMKMIELIISFYNKNHPAIILTEQKDLRIKKICSRIILI